MPRGGTAIDVGANQGFFAYALARLAERVIAFDWAEQPLRAEIPRLRAALRRAEEEILREHVAHCVAHAISSGDKADQRRKVAELMDVMGRAGR